jgi:3-isopropylmalate/(R)-2-methylmalate dehydratase small subunit
MLQGRAWKFGDNISTDEITPGRYFHLRSNLQELARYTLEDARSDFATNVSRGDFVVAGQNFGMGSSREHAPLVIKTLGVSAVLAKSFARIFYRNCINIGLPAIICNTSEIQDGNILEIALEKGTVNNLTAGIILNFAPLPIIMTRILSEGGLIPYVERYGDLVLE